MTAKSLHLQIIELPVKNVEASVKWYTEMFGCLIMGLQAKMRAKEKMFWILEKLPNDAFTEEIDGPIRPLVLIKNRDAFFTYHRFLTENGIKCGDIGGFVEKGRVLFHFYDLDGNRFNVSHC